MPMTLTQAFLLRAAAIVVAVLGGLYLRIEDFVLVVIVLGQGHFFLAYWYQGEAGKLPPRRIVLLTAAFVFLLWALFSLPFPIAGLLTALGFLIHFSFDEARLLGGGYSLFATLEGLPFILLYTALMADSILHVHWFPYALLLSVVSLIAYAYLAITRRRKPNAGSVAFLGWTTLTLIGYGLYLSVSTLDPYVWFWGIIIVHYIIWYGLYYVRLSPKPAEQREYVMRVIFVNVFFIVCAYLWIAQGFSIFWLLFTPLMSYAWTWLHGVASIRGNEFIASIRL